jgi:HAD superfamily hydrolase (TIGR01484 family)
VKRYILASDFDGTLSQKDGITKGTIEAINKFRQMGNLFGVVTGRDYVNGFEFFKENNLFPFDFIIVSNGAAAYDKEGNVYFAEKVNGGQTFGKSTLAQELIKQLLQLTLNPCGISFDKTRYDFHPNADISVLKDVDEFISSNALCDTVEYAAEVTDILKKGFGHYVNPIQNGRCIDITYVGVNKATGIAKLADCLEIPYENIWTAGDNFNDMSMIKKYHGCAMTNGVDGLKKYSEYVCDSVKDVIEIILSK